MAQVCDQPGQLCGGTGHVKRSNKEVQKICDEVKLQVEEKAGKKFDVFKATAFSTQSVAGTNYFIKVQVGEKDYIHLRVFRSLPSDGYKVSLHDIQTSKTSQDPIEYF
ncbi:cystatin-B-like [Hemibagrus wyckioides]|uniref:cystatin-B-like n=1 Tax=Hemibagrus wyckioides TaxID=337641 RepID=UPI00266C1078|nr:cystatin-B-like [Hemibagrus wyckioides]